MTILFNDDDAPAIAESVARIYAAAAECRAIRATRDHVPAATRKPLHVEAIEAVRRSAARGMRREFRGRA